jgi:hypothetical protein
VGQKATTFELIHRTWEEISPSGLPVYELSAAAERKEILAPDILLIDTYYERSEYAEKRIRLVKEQMERRLAKGQVAEQKVLEEVGEFANGIDYMAWQSELFPLWETLLSHVVLRPGILVIVMGCNMYFGAFTKLKEELSKRGGGLKTSRMPRGTRQVDSPTMYATTNGKEKSLRKTLAKIPWLKRKVFRDAKPENIQGVTLSQHAFRPGNAGLELLPLYIHHRLMVLRVK